MSYDEDLALVTQIIKCFAKSAHVFASTGSSHSVIRMNSDACELFAKHLLGVNLGALVKLPRSEIEQIETT